MKVAVVGAGSGGTAAATDLAPRGHEVTLIKTSESIHDDNFNYLLDNKEVFFGYAAMPTRAKDPTTVESRYVTENNSQGLVMLEVLGKSLNTPTPRRNKPHRVCKRCARQRYAQRGQNA